MGNFFSHLRDFAWVVNLLGLPAVITYFLYDRTKLQNENRGEELQLKETEETLPDRVKTSSVLSLEAEWLAYKKTSDAKFVVMQETIDHLVRQLAEARKELQERDEIIDRLDKQLGSVKRRVNQLQDQVDDLQRQLDAARSTGEKKKP